MVVLLPDAASDEYHDNAIRRRGRWMVIGGER